MLTRRVVVYLLLVLWVAAPAQAEETCQECQEDEGSGESGGNETQEQSGDDASSEDGPCQVASYNVNRPQDTRLDPDHCFERTINRLITT